MRKVDYLELGGTLYIPIMQKNLLKILKKEKFPFLTSIVICFEDSTHQKDVEKGVVLLQEYLNEFEVSNLKVFIRPRNISNLETILKLKNLQKIDGFVLPKIDLENIDNYLFLESYNVMLTLEKIFNEDKLFKLYEKFQNFKNILSIRIGLEDILGSFGLMRDCNKTFFQNPLISGFFFDVYKIFKPKYNLSAPVYSCLENENIFIKELQNEIDFNIFNKTIIHPNHSKIINECYKVTKKELEIANYLLSSKEAIFKANGRMFEYKTHKNWAKTIIKRGEFYGTK